MEVKEIMKLDKEKLFNEVIKRFDEIDIFYGQSLKHIAFRDYDAKLVEYEDGKGYSIKAEGIILDKVYVTLTLEEWEYEHLPFIVKKKDKWFINYEFDMKEFKKILRKNGFKFKERILKSFIYERE